MKLTKIQRVTLHDKYGQVIVSEQPIVFYFESNLRSVENGL